MTESETSFDLREDEAARITREDSEWYESLPADPEGH